MKTEQHMEKIYDLVERFDFNDLSEDDKEFILRNITVEEFENMRSTIKDTTLLFSKYPEFESKKNQIGFRKIAFYPVELYKIAAGILIILGTMFFVSQRNNSKPQNLIAGIDTVFVKKTDTVVVYVGDTIVRMKEFRSDKVSSVKKTEMTYSRNNNQTNNYKIDCTKELCPDDIRKLNALKTRNDLSEDKNLTDFMVSIN
jgi:hypothetical protein